MPAPDAATAGARTEGGTNRVGDDVGGKLLGDARLDLMVMTEAGAGTGAGTTEGNTGALTVGIVAENVTYVGTSITLCTSDAAMTMGAAATLIGSDKGFAATAA